MRNIGILYFMGIACLSMAAISANSPVDALVIAGAGLILAAAVIGMIKITLWLEK